MTWKRVINRNGLSEGNYNDVPLRHRVGVPLDPKDGTLMDEAATIAARWPHLADRAGRYEDSYAMLLGDIRRLEADGQDEQSLCRDIERRTGIKAEIVATVLKECFAL